MTSDYVYLSGGMSCSMLISLSPFSFRYASGHSASYTLLVL